MGWRERAIPVNDGESAPGGSDWRKRATPADPEAPGMGESALRGLGQGLSLGFEDEIRAGAMAPFSDRDYPEIRDAIRAKNKAAEEANPKTFGTAKVAGSIAPFIAAPEIGLAGMVGLGAAEGLGGSEADLTKGNLGSAAIDTAQGAAAGAAGYGAGKILGPAIKKGFEGAKWLGKRAISSVFNVPLDAVEARIADPNTIKLAGERGLAGLGDDVAAGMGKLKGQIGEDAGKAASHLRGINEMEFPRQVSEFPEKDINAEAENILREWDERHGDQFVEDNIRDLGGMRGYADRDLSEEFQNVPVHLRGTRPLDEMAGELADRGIGDGSESGLLDQLDRRTVRGSRPTLEDARAEALHRLSEEKAMSFDPAELEAEAPAPTAHALSDEAPNIGPAIARSTLDRVVAQAEADLGDIVGPADRKALAVIKQVRDDIANLGPNISEQRLKPILQKLDDNIDYDNKLAGPANDALLSMRTKMDTLLKRQNDPYKKAMVPVDEKMRLFKYLKGKLNVKDDIADGGPTATDATLSNLKNVLGENKSITQDKINELAGLTGDDLLAKVKNYKHARAFEGGRTNGTRNTAFGAGLGTAAGALIPIPGATAVGAAAGALFGRQVDVKGGEYAAKTIDYLLTKHPEKLGRFLPALQKSAQRGTLSVTHYLLQQTDPQYQQLMKENQESGN